MPDTAAKPVHPVLKVFDDEIAGLTASKCEHQREAANLENWAILLGILRAKAERALTESEPTRAPRAVRKPRGLNAAADDGAKQLIMRVLNGTRLKEPDILAACINMEFKKSVAKKTLREMVKSGTVMLFYGLHGLPGVTYHEPQTAAARTAQAVLDSKVLTV